MKRILLVEDDPYDAELVLRALDGYDGVAVEHVTDGELAVEALRGALGSATSLPDLVILDMHMPRLDGHGVLAALAREPVLRRVPVVVLSSSRDDGDLRRAYDAGANAYVVKSTRYREMRAAITDLARFWTRRNESPPAQ